MKKNLNVIAEAKIATADSREFAIRVIQPWLCEDRNGDEAWACIVDVVGLVEFDNPFYGDTSFSALVGALSDAFSVLREDIGNRNVQLIDGVWGDQFDPPSAMTLVELFGMDVLGD